MVAVPASARIRFPSLPSWSSPTAGQPDWRAPAPVRPRVQLPAVLRARDAAFVRQARPVIETICDHYFRAEVEGAENLLSGPSVIATTHNGGAATPDLFCLATAVWRRFGVDAPAYGLMHKAAFALPLFGRFLAKFGAIPANHANGDLVLREGFPLLVCPGGDVDALKPFRMRHRVVFDGRRGFIRMAIRNQVPVVPVVSVGAHEIFIILNEGRRTARWSGLQRYFRVKRVPMALSFPFGLTIAGVPSIPLPSKIRLRVLPPIELDERPEAADDAAVVDRCYEFIRVTMQRALDDLSAGRRFLLG